MTMICIIEAQNDAIRHSSLELLSAARQMKEKGFGSDVVALCGTSIQDTSALGANGADKIVRLAALDGSYCGDAFARSINNATKDLDPAAIILSATAQGKDLAPRVAALAGVTQYSDITDCDVSDGALLVTRPVFAGKVLLKAKVAEKLAVLTLRPKVFEAKALEANAPVEDIMDPAGDMKAVVQELLAKAGGKMDLSEADIIVAGGRGVGGSEGYASLEELATKLGGVIGASRAAVDAGWRPHSDQVGQTGKVVNPTLYFACGISGAIQHLAGMKNSRFIVAINKDPDAPIFKVADYGIVGDLFEVVPAITGSL
jgi:electron transfer flavoprotein alpha subunit